jgi:hypothetical protein
MRYDPVNNAYVYAHKRLDNKNVFYIGIGSLSNFKRAYQVDKRNEHWKRIYNKTMISVEILLTDLTWEEANSWESYLIGLHGRTNNNTGSLCNMTNGGDGVRGWVATEETRKRMSESKKGFRHTEENKLLNKIAHSKPLVQMTRDGKFVREWDCAYDAARELFEGKGPSKIGDCCRGTRKTHKNFTWKFKNK